MGRYGAYHGRLAVAGRAMEQVTAEKGKIVPSVPGLAFKKGLEIPPSCHRFRSNEVRLWLSMIAYSLGNPWRRLVLPRKIEGWTLTSRQQRLVKTGGRLVKHARYYWLLLAESHLTRLQFGAIVRRIEALPVPTGKLRLRRDRKLDKITPAMRRCLKNWWSTR